MTYLLTDTSINGQKHLLPRQKEQPIIRQEVSNMKSDLENIKRRILEHLDHISYVHPEDIPSIDLYMDQVTTFMERELGPSRRYENDKVLTKTMINNYAKNHLLPPPVKKKYSKEHLLLLVFIYYSKGILSLQDIRSVLEPLSGEYFNKKDGISISDIYQEILNAAPASLDQIREDLSSAFEHAGQSFPDAPEEDKEFLQFFSLITELSLDIYLKKRIIEKLIDTVINSDETSRSEKKGH